MDDSPGRLTPSRIYDFREIESRWHRHWDDAGARATPDTPEPPQGTYYVLQSPPNPLEDGPRGNLKGAFFAEALIQYHRSRGQRVLTDCGQRTFDGGPAPDWAKCAESLGRSLLGTCDGVDLIIGATEIDQARVLTKTLRGLNVTTDRTPRMRALALGIVTSDGHTPMTTIEPHINRYGADTVGCYTIFMGPAQHDMPWSDGQLGGVHRFLSRLWRLAQNIELHGELGVPKTLVPADLELLGTAHETIDRVTRTMEGDLRLHLAIAAIARLVTTSLRAGSEVAPETLRFALASAARLLFPFAPHCAADVYYQLTGVRVWDVPWPVAHPIFRKVVIPGKPSTPSGASQ